MKRKTMIIWGLICAACNMALGIILLRHGLSNGSRYTLAAGIIWLLMAAAWAIRSVIWIVRAVRERRKEQQVPKAPPGEES